MSAVERSEEFVVATFHVRLLEFLETKNPLYAWAAYQFARKHDAPIPDWVHSVLEWTAGNLLTDERDVVTGDASEFDPIDAKPDKWAAKAMGLESRGRGKETARQEFARREKERAIALEVFRDFTLAGEDGIGIWKTAQSVAAKYGVSEDTAARAFKTFAPGLISSCPSDPTESTRTKS